MENRDLLIKLRTTPKTQDDIDLIKRKFLANDIKYKDIVKIGEQPNVDLKHSRIEAEVITGKSIKIDKDEFGLDYEIEVLEYDLEEIDFYDEFEKASAQLFKDYCKKAIKEMGKKGVYTSYRLEGFKKTKLKKINDFISELQNNTSIDLKIKNSLLEFYQNLYDFISDLNLEDYQISDKLKFNLSRNQVIWLFQSMYEKGIISGISSSDLYRFIDANFEYGKRRESKAINNSRIQANKFKKDHASLSKTIEGLENIFGDNFFSSSE